MGNAERRQTEPSLTTKQAVGMGSVEECQMLSSDYYTVVRDSNFTDRMFYTQHRLGGHSNILVSAHYANTTAGHNGDLSNEAVFAALRQVVNTYPELALIGVPKAAPGETKHHLHLAALHEIDLETCVEFRDEEDTRSTREMLESLHNEWDLTSDNPNPRKPWWKVVVLGRQQVAFVAHHLVCDGRFLTMFHIEFLKSLNAWAPSKVRTSRIIKIDAERTRLSPKVQEFWTSSQFVFWSLIDLLRHVLIHFFLGQWLLLSSPSMPPSLPSKLFPSSSEIKYRPGTKVSSVRISSSTMSQIIKACHEQETTFTPFFNVIMLGVLVDKHYPKALLGGSYCATDMRGVYPKPEPGSGQLLSCGGGFGHLLRLGRYRGTFDDIEAKDTKQASKQADVQKVWDLTRQYRSWLNVGMSGDDPEALKIYRINNSGSIYLEDMASQMLPILGYYLRATFTVSNLGAFAGETGEGPWKIDDASFSAGASHASVSYKLCVNIVGVKGGDTVLNAAFEEGVLSRDMVDSVLKETVDRMQRIVQLSQLAE